MKQKFEVGYFVPINELPFRKCKKILSPEKHSFKMGDTESVCTNFIDFIGLDLKDQLNKDLAKVKFFSVLPDGYTDSLLTKNEIIYCLYFEPKLFITFFCCILNACILIGVDSIKVKYSSSHLNISKIFHQIVSTQLSVIQLKKHLNPLDVFWK